MLNANESRSISSNSEFLFVSGSAWAKEAGLLDLTTGASVEANTKLLENHLYAVTGDLIIYAETESSLVLSQ